MAECFLVQRGGMPLNFKVVPNPMPSTAKENTIWVDTDKINNYYFSAEQPENMVDYDIWFTIGTSSQVAFSVTKKNTVMVYPIFAKQYVGGAWVDVAAKSYQGGEWVDWWGGMLYYAGNEYELFTGGWGKVAEGNPSFSKNASTLYVSKTASSGTHTITHNEPVDLTNIKTVEFDYSCNYPSRAGFYVYDINLQNVVGSDSQSSASGTCRLDVSALTGKHYIGFGVWFVANGTYNVTVSRIKLVS